MSLAIVPNVRSSARLQLLGLGFLVVLSLALLVRVVLTLWTASDAELDMLSAPAVFGCGALYDLAFAAIFLAPAGLWLLLPARVWRTRACGLLLRVAFFLGIFVLVFSATAEFVFFDEFGTRFNFIAVDYLVYTTEVLQNIRESYAVGWLLLGDAIVTALIYALLQGRVSRLIRSPSGARPAATAVLWGLALLFGTLLDQGPRSMFANTYARELASNGPYQLFAAFRNNEIDYERFYPTLPMAEVDRLVREQVAEPNAHFLSTAPLDIRRRVDNPGPARRLNVVLIMVESLGADFMGYLGDRRGMTPHLDRLATQSLVFDQFYATGTRTVRGLEAVTLSIPPTPGSAIVKRLGRESGLWSLAAVLNTAGYASYFLYGGRAYFDNMGAFFGGNGYTVIDQASTPADDIGFANAWGMSDEDLYRQVLGVARREHAAGKPFFMHVMTTSNHRPYTFPAGRIDLPPGGRRAAVRYSDWAIADFLARARAEPWFDDTLFIVLGDHCANSAGKVALPAERYRVPLIIHAPRHIVPAHVQTLSSQIDVAPTLLALMGLDYDSAFFGRDILASEPEDGRALIGNYQYLGLFSNEVVTVLGPRQELRQYPAAATGTAAVLRPAGTDELVHRAIALYQGASYVYSHRLNAWRAPIPEDQVWLNTAAKP